MPRPPSVPHVLRAARKTKGLSQEKLAQKVGVATITIARIESCRLKLSRSLAMRISIATGLDPYQLLENENPDFPRFHSKPIELPTSEQRAIEVRQLSLVMDDILARARNGREFWILRYSMNQALGNLRK